MTTRNLLWGGLLSLAAAALLVYPDTAQAQRFGFGAGRGGVSFGVGSGYGYGNPGFYGSGWGYSPYSGYNNYGWNNGWNNGNWNYWGNNGYGQNYYNPGVQATYTYQYPSSTYQYPSTGYQAFYPSTQGNYNYGSTSYGLGARNDRLAHIEVRVPANAEVFFDGHKTNQNGSVRYFESPELDPNQNFTYSVRARWNENGQDVERTKQITVRAGQTEMVDFTANNTPTDTNRLTPNARIQDIPPVNPNAPTPAPSDRTPTTTTNPNATTPAPSDRTPTTTTPPNRGNIRDIPPTVSPNEK